MPVYEYYCRTCNTKFEQLRPMSASAQSTECPDGHEDAMRTLSLVARMGGGSAADMLDWSAGGAGGCGCGGACSCGSFGAN